jgi:hypothetical protein
MSVDHVDDVWMRFQRSMNERQVAIENAAPTVGGDFRWLIELSPPEAFVKAARAVLESGRQVSQEPFVLRTGFQAIATPCAFMQRHALELIIKAYWSLAGRLGGMLGYAAVNYRETKIHDLKGLISRANKHMAALRVQTRQLTIPADIVALADEIAVVESGDETAFRYETGKGGAPNLPQPVSLPIGDWQRRLEAILEHMKLSDVTAVRDFNTLTTYQWMAVYETLRGHDPSFTM